MNARTVHDGPALAGVNGGRARGTGSGSAQVGDVVEIFSFRAGKKKGFRVPGGCSCFLATHDNTISWYWQDQDPPRPAPRVQNTTLSSARTRPSLLALIPSNARKRKQASLPRGYTICTGQTATTLVYRGGVYSVLSRCQGHVASFRARLLDECTRQPARGASKLAASRPWLADASRLCESRHAPQEQRQRRSWAAGRPGTQSLMDQRIHSSWRQFASYDHPAVRVRTSAPFNRRSPDHHKKSPGMVLLSPSSTSSAASACFFCSGGAAAPGASSSTYDQTTRAYVSATAGLVGVAGAARQQFVIPVRLRTELHRGGDWCVFLRKRSPEHAEGQR
jgi:hypothetical protein